MDFPEFGNMTLEEAIQTCVKAYDDLPLPAQARKRDIEMLIIWLDHLKRFRQCADVLRQTVGKLPS